MSEQFLDDVKISHRLLSETERSYRARDPQRYTSLEDWQELNYSLKTALRCFFGLVDAQTFAMRKAVLRAVESQSYSISNRRKLAELQERVYDREKDEITENIYRVGFAKRFRLAFRHFPKLYEANYELNADVEEYRGFRNVLLRDRNKLTHPKRLEDLFPLRSLKAFRPTVLWYMEEWDQLLTACFESSGIDLKREEREWDRYRDSDLDGIPAPGEILDEEFYEIVQADESASIAYITRMLRALADEVTSALRQAAEMGYCTDAQFARRNLARTLFSVAEGLCGLIGFHLSNLHDQGKIELSGDESEILSSRAFSPENFVDRCTLFSAKVGTGDIPRKSVATWHQFRQAHRIRDNVTHPRKLEEIHISNQEFEVLQNAVWWFNEEVLANLTLVASHQA